MQLKPITAIIVLSLAVASLSVAGCTTSNTNQTPSATPSTAAHDAFLETFLTLKKDAASSDKNLSIKAWEIDWINSTSARVQSTAVVKPSNYTWNYDTTYVVFPTSQDATNYLNALNKTAYSLYSTDYPSGGTYQTVTGHTPQIYKDYTYNEGNPNNISDFKRHEIQQADNLIIIDTAKVLYTA